MAPVSGSGTCRLRSRKRPFLDPLESLSPGCLEARRLVESIDVCILDEQSVSPSAQESGLPLEALRFIGNANLNKLRYGNAFLGALASAATYGYAKKPVCLATELPPPVIERFLDAESPGSLG